MCNVCTFNVNGCGYNRSNNNGCGCGCGNWLTNLFSGTTCQSTYNRCQTTYGGCNRCQTAYNGCNSCQSTYNRCQRNCGCVTICGNLSALFSGSTASTNNQNSYYSRLYGLNTTSGSGCGCRCGSGYNFEQTD